MEAALAEMALDTAVESIEDDVDFVNDKDEEDVFGSDFESTDEEAAQEDADIGDKATQEEEKRARKDARSRLERATAAAHARQKVTFNPQEATTSKLKPKDPKRRVSLGVAVNVETGEVLPAERSRRKRHSQRKHTILNTSAAVARLKQSEEKKAATPKKAKIESKTYTQAELIALALDNEEGNIVDHRDYLKVEEEKRRRARVVRTAVEGPLIRWISRAEEIKVVVPPPPAPTFTPARAGFSYMPYSTMGSTPYGQSTPYTYSAGVFPHMATAGYATGYALAPVATASTATAGPSSESVAASQQPSQQVPQSTSVLPRPTSQPLTQSVPSTTPQVTPASQIPTSQLSAQPTSTQSTPQLTSGPTSQPATMAVPYQPTHYNPYLAQLQSVWSPPPPPPPVEKIEKVTKNYVVHELAQTEAAPKPPWNETMSAMFGDDVQWDELKVYVGKNRPLSRPKQTCPITGKQANYLDPRSGVPFADVRAFEVLTKLLAHEFTWSPSLGRYVGQDNANSANSTPDGS
ncbi:hypothetical protein C0991_004858 [Blastosporella zonata]|nr:hypothetical protein C0991_004858 [Blastosporella zonata]